MAYSQKTWKDTVAEYPNRRVLTDASTQATQTVTVTRSVGTVSQEGDAWSAENMNDMEDRIASEFSSINSNLTDNYYTKTEVDSKGINYVDNNFGSITLTANQEKTLSFTLEDATKEIIGYNVICVDGSNAWIGQSVYGMIANGNSATIRMINIVTSSVSGTLIIRFFYR